MTVIKNYLYNVTYQLFVLLIPFVTTPYIARVLEANGVGINAYTASVMQYFILFAGLGINLYGNREIAYHQHDKTQYSRLFYEIYSLRLILVSIVCLVFVFFLMHVQQYKQYYIYQSFSLIAVAFDISWLFMGLEDFKKTVMRNMIIKLTSLCLIFTLVKTPDDIGKYILILSLSVLFGNISLFSYLKRTVESLSHFKKLRPFRHLKATFILFIPQISISVYLVLNKTILGFFQGAKEVGYFENADKLIALLLAVLTATKTVLLPRVAHLHSQGKKEETKQLLYRCFRYLTLLALPATIALMVIGIPFSLWFFGDKFYRTGVALILHAPTLLFVTWSTVIGQQYLMPLNRMREYNRSIYITALVTVILDLIVVQPFGLYGIAVVSCISEGLVVILQMMAIRHEVVMRDFFKEFHKILFASIVMAFVLIGLHHCFAFNSLTLIGDIIIGLITYSLCLYVLNVSVIKQVMSKVLERKK